MLMPVQARDGTTSVVVMAGALLDAADKLLQKGIHPTTVSESFQKSAAKFVDILTEMAIPLELTDRDVLLKAANTSLNSKVVSQNSAELSPIAVDAVLKVVDPASLRRSLDSSPARSGTHVNEQLFLKENLKWCQLGRLYL